MANKICIYLDYATIPSLHYFLHFAENSEDKETVRLFGLSRFSIPENIIEQYPKDIIQFYRIKEKDISLILNRFGEIISSGKWDIEFHFNLCHYVELFFPFIVECRRYRINLNSLFINFYDDGTEGVIHLYKIFKLDNLQESIVLEKERLINFVNTSKFVNGPLSRYFLGKLFPSKYYFLDTRLLDSDRLLPLKSEIGNYQQMNLERFNSLSHEKQALFLKFFDLDENMLFRIKRKLLSKQSFLFLGTTSYVKEHIEWLYSYQEELIKQFCLEDGMYFKGKRNFVFFYKGHPNERELNRKILNSLDFLEEYPDDIPLEVFHLLGLLPDRVGGMVSSSLFNFERNCIDDVIFMVNKKDEIDEQYSLMKSLVELDIINSDNVQMYIDIINKFPKGIS